VPRRPQWDVALSGAERQRRYMERLLRKSSVTETRDTSVTERDADAHPRAEARIVELEAELAKKLAQPSPPPLQGLDYADIAWIDDVIKPMCEGQRKYVVGAVSRGLDWEARLDFINGLIDDLESEDALVLLTAKLIRAMNDDLLTRTVQRLQPAGRKRIAAALTAAPRAKAQDEADASPSSSASR
jgi:hypothetical protein